MQPEDAEKQPLLANEARKGQHKPTLSELQHDASRAQRRYMREWNRQTDSHGAMCLMISTTAFLIFFLLFACFISCPVMSAGEASPIPLEAHIMSKCPDAKDCLHDLVLPAMIKVGDKVDFKLSYIGRTTDHDDGVLCKHGPQECLGNIIELCAAKIYPEPRIYLGFTMCLTNNYKDIPNEELVQECALEHGISVAKLNDCAVDDDGVMSVNMLQDSFQRSADANVSTSCTVRLDEKTYCVRDDGKWKDCKNGSDPQTLIDEIERQHQELRNAPYKRALAYPDHYWKSKD